MVFYYIKKETIVKFYLNFRMNYFLIPLQLYFMKQNGGYDEHLITCLNVCCFVAIILMETDLREGKCKE